MADLESRNSAFSGGATPGGNLPSPNGTGMQPQVDPMFSPASILAIPNAVKTANGESPTTYMGKMMPYAASSSPMAKAMQAERGPTGVMNV